MGPTRLPAFVHILAVQNPQRHADTGQLPVDLAPVGLLLHAPTFPAPGEQQRVYLVVRPVGDVIPADAGAFAASSTSATLRRDMPWDLAIARPDNPWPCKRRTSFACIFRTIAGSSFHHTSLAW